MTTRPPADRRAAPATAPPVALLLDRALVDLAAGRQRAILELLRDNGDALGAMAARMGTSRQAVSDDVSMFHALEFARQLEELPARYDDALLEAAGIMEADKVLDIGCGTGPSSRAAAKAAPAGVVLGIDISVALVQRARMSSRAERLANLRFDRGDAEVYQWAPDGWDVAISRFGAMYFHHPVLGFANIARGLRPGGRLAMLVWQEAAQNEWTAAAAGALAGGQPVPERGDDHDHPGAFALADPDDVRTILGEAGFTDIRLDGHRQPVCLGPDTARAYAMVSTQGLARELLDGLGDADRKARLDALRATLAAHETPEGVLFDSAAWLVTATRP